MKAYFFVSSFLILCTTQAQKADVNLSKGNEYYKQTQYDLAEKHYRLALKTNPDNVTAQYNLANALYRQKKNNEAQEILRHISAKAPNQNMQSAAYYNEGVIYSKQKALEESIEAYKNALRLNPDDKNARENLQKALLELKQKQQQKQKDQQQNRQPQSNISQKEAQRRLDQLQQKEKKIQERLQNKQGGNPMPKDW